MALTIGSNTSTTGLERAREAIAKRLNQLSSGQRITRAGDDAASLAISEGLRATERAFAQGQRNLSDGVSLARTAEGALAQVSDIGISTQSPWPGSTCSCRRPNCSWSSNNVWPPCPSFGPGVWPVPPGSRLRPHAGGVGGRLHGA